MGSSERSTCLRRCRLRQFVSRSLRLKARVLVARIHPFPQVPVYLNCLPINSCNRRASLVTVGALPAALGNIEDHAIGIFELALEIAVPLLAEIEEEFAAIGFDAPLRFGEIVDLKAKMVRSDIAAWIFQVGGLAAARAGEIE